MCDWMKISELRTFVENLGMELQGGASGSCVRCCFSVVVVTCINDGPEATRDAKILTTLWRNWFLTKSSCNHLITCAELRAKKMSRLSHWEKIPVQLSRRIAQRFLLGPELSWCFNRHTCGCKAYKALCPSPLQYVQYLELPRPSVQESAVVLNRLSLCTSASRTSESPERAVSWGILDLSLEWKQLDSLFVVLNNCTSLWKGPLCSVAHDRVSGSSLGRICLIIHWGEENLHVYFKEAASEAQ